MIKSKLVEELTKLGVAASEDMPKEELEALLEANQPAEEPAEEKEEEVKPEKPAKKEKIGKVLVLEVGKFRLFLEDEGYVVYNDYNQLIGRPASEVEGRDWLRNWHRQA